MQEKKRVPWLIVLVVLVVAAGGGLWYWLAHVRGFVTTDDALIDGKTVVVSARILGRISKLAVDEGEQVTAGEVVARLDDSDLKAQETLARSNVVSAEKNEELARVNLDRASGDAQRAERLYAQKGMSQEQYDHARSAASAARAQLAIAVAQRDSAHAQLGVIETQLHNTVLVSPVSGVVAKSWLSEGEVVQPAQAILTITDLADVWVTANFEETKLRHLAIGAPVDINVDAYPGRQLTGKVVSIGSNTAAQFSLIPASNAAGNFTKITQRVPVKIALDPGSDPDPAGHPSSLLPGMSAEVRVRVQ